MLKIILHTFDDLDITSQFSKKHKLPHLTQYKISNPNSRTIIRKIKITFFYFIKKLLGPDGFPGKFNQILNEQLTLSHTIPSANTSRQTTPQSFDEANTSYYPKTKTKQNINKNTEQHS